ncbi:hypothetical protein BJ170DRAFT_182519 [Xylariales sp. AK1849]|nr:hypothetical protein BJ170DRAFT_182519 [Xylariales sp. AK1849]
MKHLEVIEIGRSGSHNSVSVDKPPRTRWSSSWWGSEILSASCSALLLATIFYILLYMGNQPSESWASFISMNTMIAILTTGYKSVMLHSVSACIGQAKWLYFKTSERPHRLYNLEMFDESSRGPAGSALFLCNVRWGWASVGAIVTILALAIDPFTQQVIHLQPQETLVNHGGSSFEIAHEYNRNVSNSALAFGALSRGIPQDFLMQGAMLKGIFNITTTPVFSCDGSCVWNDTYVSLGISSTCNNVTQATLQSKVCPPDGVPSRQCNMTTPGNIRLSTSGLLTEWATTLLINTSSTFSTYDESREVWDSEILKFAVYRASTDYKFNNFYENVTECTLNLAAYEYSNVQASGVNFNVGTLRKTLLNQGHDSTGVSIAYEEDGLPPLTISMLDLAAMQYFLASSLFNIHVITGDAPSTFSGGVCASNVAAAALTDSDLGATFDNMAASMTDYLRSRGPNVQLTYGSRVESVIYVQVRWVFLVLPVTVEVTALVFVIVTIVCSRRQLGVPLWKSSALALLAHLHDDGDGSLRSEMLDPVQLEEIAKSSKAGLVY